MENYLEILQIFCEYSQIIGQYYKLSQYSYFLQHLAILSRFQNAPLYTRFASIIAYWLVKLRSEYRDYSRDSARRQKPP